VRAENPLMQRAHTKDAVSAAVAAGDRDAKAAHAFMVLQIARDLKPLFLEIVVSHHRHRGIECKTGIAIGSRCGQDRSNHFLLPAKPGTKHELGIARQQFEDFDKIDRERERDGADGIVQEPLKIGLRQRSLGKLRQRLLLLDAAA
jgi:hypothetical protein